jgi:replicative DNA helicase
MQDITTLLDELTTNIYKAQEMTSGISGVETGFTEFDRLTGGLQKSELILISGSVCMGKTAFALSMIRNKVHIDSNVGIIYFSTRLSEMQLVQMLVCGEMNVELSTLKRGLLSVEQQNLLNSFIEQCKTKTIYIDDTPNQGFDQLLSEIEDIRSSYLIECIFIDNLNELCQNNKTDIETGLKELKDLAKIIDLPVIVLHESEELEITDTSIDFYDIQRQISGYKQVDMHCFLHRPEYYRITEDESGHSVLGDAELFILRNRGNTGSIKLKYDGRMFQFQKKRS